MVTVALVKAFVVSAVHVLSLAAAVGCTYRAVSVSKIEENSALSRSVKYANQLSRDERLGSTVRGSLCFSLLLRRISSARRRMRV